MGSRRLGSGIQVGAGPSGMAGARRGGIGLDEAESAEASTERQWHGLGLPTYTGQADLMPLGTVCSDSNDGRTVGVPLEDVVLSYSVARCCWGKTETAAARFVALARAGHGCLFFDPYDHPGRNDHPSRMRPYLTSVAERVWEIDLTAQDHQAAWNPLAMEGFGADDVEAKVSVVVSSLETVWTWTSGEKDELLRLTTMAVRSLVELSLVLPPDLAPTLFQTTTMLVDEDWREEVLPHLSPASQAFWLTEFPRANPAATAQLASLIEQLRSSPALAGLLGAPRSSYDIRRAMDSRAVVQVGRHGLARRHDRFAANLFVYDMLRAAKSRQDIPPEQRWPFHAFLDDVRVFDGPRHLGALLEESIEYEVRPHLVSITPRLLRETTLDAVLTNCTHLLSASVDEPQDSAGHRLPLYWFLASVTLGDRVFPPFPVRGLTVSELFEPAGEEVTAAAGEIIDANVERRPISETLAALDTLDRRILHQLRTLGPQR